jgi:hypothetical protein
VSVHCVTSPSEQRTHKRTLKRSVSLLLEKTAINATMRRKRARPNNDDVTWAQPSVFSARHRRVSVDAALNEPEFSEPDRPKKIKTGVYSMLLTVTATRSEGTSPSAYGLSRKPSPCRRK